MDLQLRAVRCSTKHNPGRPGSTANTLGFDGEYLDPTGLYHLRARQLDPTTGKFTSPDPVSASIDSPSVSSYLFANQEPLRFTDPTGQFIFGVCGSASFYLFGGSSLSGCISTDFHRIGIESTQEVTGGAGGGFSAGVKFGSGGLSNGVIATGDIGGCYIVCLSGSVDSDRNGSVFVGVGPKADVDVGLGVNETVVLFGHSPSSGYTGGSSGSYSDILTGSNNRYQQVGAPVGK